MVLSKFPIVSRNLPLVNLAIATTALGFQVAVLYPWHLTIDDSHKNLIKKMEEHERLLKGGGGGVIGDTAIIDNRAANPNQQPQKPPSLTTINSTVPT
ncbi:hypothetical protein RB653_010641 [Dictyostelium firmibasis]|uniref:Uncharacterized protein n=1 Tax=Dictyostelium firmibasis TaxID=79012 RepID=A0AAN7TT06_9MYCE